MIFKAEDGTRIYARTIEWGASDLKSEMMLVPRVDGVPSSLGDGKRRGVEEPIWLVGVYAGGLAYRPTHERSGIDRRRAVLSGLRAIPGN